jgi:CoA:oxalate CoA-transferase
MSTSAPRPTPGPFSGILVVDLIHVLNGPFGTTILDDLRARLIPPTRVGAPDKTLSRKTGIT